MTERYQVVSTQDSPSTLDSSALADFLAKDGQLLLPVIDLIETAEYAIDDLIDVMGRATIEAVLLMSAAQLAGPKQQGKKSDRDVVYHGSQKGRVPLRERELNVEKPRLRKKNPKPGEPGEVEIPAYKAIREHGGLADRMLQILIAGVSTRRYKSVIPEMARPSACPRARCRARPSKPANNCSKAWPSATSPSSTSWPSGSTEFSLGRTT